MKERSEQFIIRVFDGTLENLAKEFNSPDQIIAKYEQVKDYLFESIVDVLKNNHGYTQKIPHELLLSYYVDAIVDHYPDFVEDQLKVKKLLEEF
jgi:hypothetical protein